MTEAENAGQTPTTATATPDATATGAPTHENGTAPSEGGQAKTSTPAQETFTEVNPENLSQELRGVYDNMLRDYTAKTQKLAEQRKALEGVDVESLRQKAEQYDRLLLQTQENQQLPNANQEADLANDPELIALWQEAQADPVKAIEFHKRVAQKEAESARMIAEEAKTAVMSQRAESLLDAFIEAVDPKTGQKLRPDFGDINDSGLIQMEFDKVLEAQPKNAKGEPMLPEKEWGKAVETAYQRAKKIFDAIEERGYKRALAEQQRKLAASTERPSVSAQTDVENITPEKARNLSVADAVRLAKQGKVLAKTY